MRTAYHLTCIVLGGIVLAACTKESSRPDQTASSAGAGTDTMALSTRTVDSAAGALANRREAQQLFESARAALVQKQTRNAAAELRRASAYFVRLADSTSGAIRTRVGQTHRGLDSLASKLEARTEVSVRELDRAFARANYVESERHLARSHEAWTRSDTSEAAGELLIAVDHLERAAKDAGSSLGRAGTRTVADARRLSNDLLRQVPPANGATMARVHEDMTQALHTLRERLDER
jgi:hypothetical protein